VRRQAAGSALVVDFVLGAMLAEFVWLWWRRGFAPRAAAGPLIALGPGACLALASRAAVGGSFPAIALALAAALPFHLADLARRPLR
jgi:hypothetical protein